MRNVRRQTALLRILLTFGVAVPLALAGVATLVPAQSAAAQPGSVLYSPDLTSNPDGTAGYPRAIRLEHSGNSAQTMLATFAKAGHGSPTTLPIYRSADDGNSWSKVSEIESHTPGWDLEAPTLFEVPRDIPGLNQGDILAAGTAWKVGDYSAQKVEVFRSTDGGTSWGYLSTCTETSGLPDTWGHGIWEPTFVVADDGTLACFISDERPAGGPTNNQIIGHYTSTDGGQTWSSSITADVAFPADDLARPGMQTFTELPNGQFAMSYELCRDATDADHACEVYIKYSDDGLDWGPLGDPGTLVHTSDQRQLLHTPYIAWVPTGGADGTLLISGQRVVSGPTGNKTVLAESGTVLFANTNLGHGDWFELATPVTVDPTGGYNDGEPSCPGYSTPMIPRADGSTYLYLAATWLGVDNQCEVRFGIGTVPTRVGSVTNPESGKCLDVDGNTSENGKAAQLWACNIASGQNWSIWPDGTIRSFGKCLDVDAQGTANFTPVQLWECNGSGAQQWEPQPDGSLLNPQSGRCLDVPQGRTEDGTDLQIYDCNGLWTQKWELPS